MHNNKFGGYNKINKHNKHEFRKQDQKGAGVKQNITSFELNQDLLNDLQDE